MQTYFVLATAAGEIMTIPVDNPANKVSIDIDSKDIVCSLTCQHSTAYLGTESGAVLKVDLNSRKVVTSYDSGSKFPIFNIKTAKNRLILGTCQGELHLTDLDLKEARVISAHHAMISMLLISGSILYTTGDDMILRVW